MRYALVCFFLLASPAFADLKVDTGTYKRRVKEGEVLEKAYSFSAGNLKVSLDQKPSLELERSLRRTVEKTIYSVGSNFGFTPYESAELILLEGDTYDSIDDPDIATGGFYAGKKIRMRFDASKGAAGLKSFERVFRHEYTHLIINSIDAGKTPRWLNEGLAEYMERESSERSRTEGREFYREQTKAGTLIPIRKFVSTSLSVQYTQNNETFYKQSYLYARSLADFYGFAKIRELFKSMKEGLSFAKAFDQTFNITLEQLESRAYGN